MLVFPRKVHHLRDLRLGHLVRENATFPDAVMMHVQHDSRGGLAVLVEELLEHVNDELHRRVVVIQQKNAVEARPFCLRLGLGDYGRAGRAALAVARSARNTISVMLAYSDRLERFTRWYVQLWAESLGKDGKGTTPLVALGPVDQHSQLQLFIAGPRDKVNNC